MMQKKNILALLLAIVLIAGVFAGCSNNSGTNNEGSTNTNEQSNNGGSSGQTDLKPVNIVYYLWGSEGPANKDILAEINKKLKADLNCTLEIKYIDWPDVNTKYPLLFASGEKFDMSHASPNAPVSYYTLAKQGVLTDITDMLDKYAPKLKAEIPEETWAGNKVDGKIYGVPTLYSEFTPYGYVYRTDLAKKYNLSPITSPETMEAYMDAITKNEKFPALNGNSNDAQNLYRLFVGYTGSWIAAPGIPLEQMYLVAQSASDYKNIIHPAFTDQFVAWAKLMKKWADSGYWPKDILSSQVDAKTNFNNGASGGFITHMPDWTGNYGALKQTLPNAETDFWCPEEQNNKILKKAGVENSTVISVTSDNPERALMVIEKFMTDESYYRLIQYGIEGRQYEIVDGKVRKPASYNPDVDGGGFAAWALRNDKFNIPLESEDPRRYELIDKWKETAIDNPFVGFSFDSQNVNSELASIANVNSQLGIQIMLGKAGDPEKAVEQYRNQLKQAGIDKVIAEVKAQLENFTPIYEQK